MKPPNPNQNSSIQLQAEFFQGPLPHPDILRKYQQIDPRALQLILDQFEKQTDHRQKLEVEAATMTSAQIAAEIDLKKKQERRLNRGEVFSFIIILSILGATIFALIAQKDTKSFYLFVTEIVGAAGAFIYREKQIKRLKSPPDA